MAQQHHDADRRHLSEACGPVAGGGILAAMWNQPYLETFCRSALHRLLQSEAIGRPSGLKDGHCLERLAGDGFAALRPDGRYVITAAGTARHAVELLRHEPA